MNWLYARKKGKSIPTPTTGSPHPPHVIPTVIDETENGDPAATQTPQSGNLCRRRPEKATQLPARQPASRCSVS